MSIIDAWVHRVAVNRGYTKATLDSGVLASILGGGNNANSLLSGSNDRVDAKTAIRSSWVFSNVDTIGKLAAESQLIIKRQKPKGGYEPDPDHAFENLFIRPNPHMSKSYVIRYTSMWLQLRGEAAWLLVPDKTGELAEIWPLPSDRVEAVADSKSYISGYWYTPEGHGKKKVFLPPEYICYFREPSIFSYREGMSKLDSLQHAIATDRLASGWNLDTFENDVALRTLISLPSDISRGTFTQVKDEILHQLVNERKRFIIARGGELKAESIGLSHKDMEFLAGREFTREEIDRVFGFPAGFWAKEATEANSRSALNVVINFSVWPQLTMFAEEITAQILTRYYPDEMIVAEFTDIRRDNIELKLKTNEQRYESMTVDEVRADQGLEKHPNEVYGSMPYALRTDARAVALFVSIDMVVDGTLHIDEIGNRLRKQEEMATSEEDKPDEPTEDDTEDDEPDTKAMLKEWERYHSIAKRNVKRGTNPSVYEFHSQVLDPTDLDLTRFALAFARDTKAVDASFHLHEHIHEVKATTEEGEDMRAAILALIALYLAGDITAQEFETQVVATSNQYANAAAVRGYGEDELPEGVTAELEALGLANPAAATRLRERIDKDGNADIATSMTNMWAGRADFLYTLGLVHNATNPILEWRRGNTLKPCNDCLNLDGTKKRASEWLAGGILPKQGVKCSYGCGCTLE